MDKLIQGNYVEILGILPAVMLLAILAFIVQIDRYLRADLKRIMRLIVVTVGTLVLQNYLECRLAEGEVRWLARTLVSIYGYAARPLILVLFLRVIEPQRRFIWPNVLVLVNAVIYATALFSHICFRIDGKNHYQGGPLNNVCAYISVVLLVYLFIETIRSLEPQRFGETWVPALVVLMILGGIALDGHVGVTPQPITFLTVSVVIGSMAYYIWLHLQFVREHEQALQAEQRIQIMMTQIQPHFLYNTIATIRALCRTDADRAGEVAEKFSDYLRRNLDSLGTVGLIPFEKELEHTRIYAEIEMVRFDNIRVEYAIEDDDFSLPPLSLQPLVENAIRHGVRIREEGIVRIETRRGETGHEIEVWDNGSGFDVSRIETADSSHIGIRNVRERIEQMCRGTLKIVSRKGEGTTVTITIPFS